MKKNFKTIMALTAALAVSVSGMSMVSAGNQTVNGNDAGQFDPVEPIPVTLTTEHLLSASIDYGDFELNYSLKDGKFSDTSFDGTNNKLTVTNQSTCPINVEVDFTLGVWDDVLDECGFKLTSDSAGESTIEDLIELTYDGDTTAGKVSTSDAYLTATKTEDLEAIHGYQFNNTTIGNITVILTRNAVECDENGV